MLRVLIFAVVLFTTFPLTAQAPFGAKPYMGWSSWSLMREDPTEAKILAQADALGSSGLAGLGFVYVNVDDGWSSGWDESAMPRVDLTRFPHGMEEFGRALHKRGLQFGIYLNPGVRGDLYDANPLISGTPIRVRDITDPSRTDSTRNPHHANNPEARSFRIDMSKPGAMHFIQAR